MLELVYRWHLTLILTMSIVFVFCLISIIVKCEVNVVLTHYFHTIIKMFKKIIVCVLEFFYIFTCVIFKIKACGYSELWSNTRYDISFQFPSSRNSARILKENTSTLYHYRYNYFCVCGILCTWMVKFSPGTDRSISKTDWRPIQPCILVHVDATKFFNI